MKKLLPILFAALAATAITTSCEKTPHDPDGRNTDFTVPALTDANTIRFTVDADAGRRIEIVLEGGRIAVDWGDGSPMTKDRDVHLAPGTSDPDMEWRVLFRHTYAAAGEYTVKIWSDEVTFFVHQTVDGDLDDLHVGNCPALKEAWLYAFSNTTLDLGGCPALESLSLGYCDELETVALEKCTNLQTALIFQNPVLEALDIGGAKGLTEVYCEDNENLASLDLAGCDALEYLYFSGTAVGTFDFSAFPKLAVVSCSDTKLSGIDISGNPELLVLDCCGNTLTELNVTGNPSLFYLYLANNQLNAEALDAIFTALPSRSSASRSAETRKSEPPVITRTPAISIFGNPGAEACNTALITAKGWKIETE